MVKPMLVLLDVDTDKLREVGHDIYEEFGWLQESGISLNDVLPVTGLNEYSIDSQSFNCVYDLPIVKMHAIIEVMPLTGCEFPDNMDIIPTLGMFEFQIPNIGSLPFEFYSGSVAVQYQGKDKILLDYTNETERDEVGGLNIELFLNTYKTMCLSPAEITAKLLSTATAILDVDIDLGIQQSYTASIKEIQLFDETTSYSVHC